MSEPTLESLASRIEALEAAMGSPRKSRPSKDWRRVVGMFGESEFMREVDEECLRVRELERDVARREAASG